MNLLLLLVWLAASAGAPASNLPAVAVLEEPTASRWLTAAGIQHADLTATQVAAGDLVATQILILPLARVRTPAAAQAVGQFVQRGGSVIAVYWGPLVRDGYETAQPDYALIDMLGARPLGWHGTGPITVRPEVSPGASLAESHETLVPRGILVTLQPAANAQILARWAPSTSARKPPPAKASDMAAQPVGAAAGAPAAAAPTATTPLGSPAAGAPAVAPPPNGTTAAAPAAAPPPGGAAATRPVAPPSPPPVSDLAVVRAGKVIFTGIDLFAPPNDTPAVRQLFLSLFEQLAPGLAFDQAREQASAVMAAIIRAQTQVGEAQPHAPGIDLGPVRQLLDQAQQAAAQAKQNLLRERYLDAESGIETARSSLQQALQLFQKLTNRTP